MKAVARLIWSYFMGAPVLRAFTIAGLILFVINLYVLATQPQSGDKLWSAIFGVVAFFLGSSLMPVIFGRLARSHSIGILPHGRLKLLVSALITTVVVAIPAGVLSPAAFVNHTSSLPELMKNPRAFEYVLQLAAITFTSAMLIASWVYLAMWFMASERNMMGTIKALLVIMIVMFAPARDIRDLNVSLMWNLAQIAVIWTVFGAGFLLWPRYEAARARGMKARSGPMQGMPARSTVGREFDLMLGTASPWLMIGAQVLPIVIATRFVSEIPSMWLFFLTIYSIVSGAVAGEAAGRSRALWLRGNWSRGALFAQVERSFWRHNAFVLGSLILVLVGLGSYAGVPARVMVAGLPLLVLGAVLSLYLGLMVTRGLRWIEGLLGVCVMLGLMAVSVLIVEEGADLATVFAMQGGLAVLAIFLRSMARRRWARIDWMQCRVDRALAKSGA